MVFLLKNDTSTIRLFCLNHGLNGLNGLHDFTDSAGVVSATLNDRGILPVKMKDVFFDWFDLHAPTHVLYFDWFGLLTLIHGSTCKTHPSATAHQPCAILRLRSERRSSVTVRSTMKISNNKLPTEDRQLETRN